ncbi:MAG: hypothetical protein ABI668_12825 [Sphingorhabdus sp.]
MAGIMFSVCAYASMPTGQHFGSWHVVSINSLSGAGDDDASALIVQEQNCGSDGAACDELRVNWLQGYNVSVSIDLNDCRGEDDDFQQSYSIPVGRWKNAGRTIEQQIENDFKTWLGQAALACDSASQARAFDLKKLRPAIRNFTERLTWFSN